MSFRPTEVRDTPKSADTRPPATDRLTKREPRLATPEELRIAIPLKEEPGPGECVLTTMLLGLAGTGFVLGPLPELARLLALGLVAQSLSFIGWVVLGITLLLGARIGWRHGMEKAIWPRAVVGLGLLTVLALTGDLLTGGSISAYRSHAVMLSGVLVPLLLVRLRRRKADAADEDAETRREAGSPEGPA